MSAVFRPLMNLPYVSPLARAAALMRTIHRPRIWRLRCLRSRVAYAIAWRSASRAGLTSRERVPLRPSASWRRRLCRWWAVTPRLTRAIACPLRFLEVRQQALDLLRVDGVHRRLAGIPTGAPRRLDLEVVAAPGVHPDHGPGARRADPLLGRLVALHLRHRRLVSLRSCWLSAGPRPRWSASVLSVSVLSVL